jgi:mannosyltransferase OCH1-like enzyme
MQTIKNKEVPSRLGYYIDQISEHNPKFTREIYDDQDIEQFIKDDPQLLEAYKNIDIGVVKADFFRLVWLLEKGGVYADIDMISLKEMENLDDTDMLVLHDRNKNELVFHFLGSVKGNPIIQKTLKECVTNINEKKHLEGYGSDKTGFISKICGPEVFSKVFKEETGIQKFGETELIKDGMTIRIVDSQKYDQILSHKHIGWSYYVDTYRIGQSYWGIRYDNVKHILFGT